MDLNRVPKREFKSEIKFWLLCKISLTEAPPAEGLKVL